MLWLFLFSFPNLKLMSLIRIYFVSNDGRLLMILGKCCNYEFIVIVTLSSPSNEAPRPEVTREDARFKIRPGSSVTVPFQPANREKYPLMIIM